MARGGGKAEPLPLRVTEPHPTGVGVFDDAPEQMVPGFPNLTNALRVWIFADFAPEPVGTEAVLC